MLGEIIVWLRKLFRSWGLYLRRFLFAVLSIGPIPAHIAFIMDGNRRYAKKMNLEEGVGHKLGFLTLLSLLEYCNELGVKYATVYAFSIDNFKRSPEEVGRIMDLVLEKIQGFLKEDSIVSQYGIRVYFIGNMKLMNKDVRSAAEKVMKATADNKGSVLSVCLAYTSSDEIVRSVQDSCAEKWRQIQALGHGGAIEVADVERNMHMAVAPDPDILIRSSGETRLSNFLLWQTSDCILLSPKALWPEMGLWHLVLAVLSFQRNYPHIEKKEKKQI